MEALPSPTSPLEVFQEALRAQPRLASNLNVRFVEGPSLSRPFPLVHVPDGKRNAYVASLENLLFRLPAEELIATKSWALKSCGVPLLHGLRSLFTGLGLGPSLHWNNWLLATHVAPALTRSELESLLSWSLKNFQRETIVFRCLRPSADSQLMKDLKELGFQFLPTRQVYLFDPQTRLTETAKRDLSRFRKSGLLLLRSEHLQTSDLPRLRDLYRSLYLLKHSPWNPDFDLSYFEAAHLSGAFEYLALCDTDRQILAMAALWKFDSCLLNPMIGYKIDQPEFYRAMTSVLLSEARARGQIFHFSSGAGEFKRRRGGQMEIECTAFYTQHLPLAQRGFWSSLVALGAPLLRRVFERTRF